MATSPKMMIGWREWVSLSAIGLPVIKAKVDTGARTSSLHAFDIEVFERNVDRRPVKFVRFSIHPLQRRNDIVVKCEAPLVDYRVVSDSGGHREKRYVIETTLKIGELEYAIEITLSNRETMAHRMLLGRSAMKPLVLDPNHSYLLGVPSKIRRAYKAPPLKSGVGKSATRLKTKTSKK